MEQKFLHSPTGDLANQEIVLISAVNSMYGAKFLQLLAGFAEFAQNSPVQFHLINFAGDVKGVRIVVVRVRVGTVEILVRTRRDTNGPGRSDIVVNGLHSEIIAQDLNPPVSSIRHIDVAVRVGLNGMRSVELAGGSAFGAYLLDVPAVLVVFHNPRIGITIGHKNIAGGIPGNIRGSAKSVWGRSGWRGVWRRRCSHTTAELQPSAHGHGHAPFRIELDDHVGAFVDDPDVVLR